MTDFSVARIFLGTRARRCLSPILIIVFLTSCSKHQTEFRLLAPALPFDREIAEDLVEIFADGSTLSIELVEMPDTADSTLDALTAGAADLAFASNTQPYRADTATVMPLYPTVLHIIYRRERDASDMRTFLSGARVFAGPPGSSSRRLMNEVLNGLELTEDVSYVSPQDVELPDVAAVYAPIAPGDMQAFLEENDAVGEYLMYSFGAPEQIGRGSEIDRALLLNPRWSPFVIPVRTYGQMNSEPVVTVAVDKLLVASIDLSAASVYDLIGEILRLQPALAAKYPILFRELNEDFDASGSTFVLHPGAQAFTQRDAPSVYERYSGVAEVVVTVLIALVSGIYAMVKIYNLRRKNRIDSFYSDAIAIRDSISDDSSINERAQAIESLRALQNTAFEMLVHEKLAADESFRIFITLSNDIISEFRD